MTLVDDFSVDNLVDRIEMRNLERSNRLDRERERLLGLARTLGASQSLSRGSKRTQHLRAVEALPLTMIAETHDGLTRVRLSLQ